MPRFLSQQSIPMKTRRPYLERYKRILREGLHNPGISPEQRAEIQQKLRNIGEPKDYAGLAASSGE